MHHGVIHAVNVTAKKPVTSLVKLAATVQVLLHVVMACGVMGDLAVMRAGLMEHIARVVQTAAQATAQHKLFKPHLGLVMFHNVLHQPVVRLA